VDLESCKASLPHRASPFPGARAEGAHGVRVCMWAQIVRISAHPDPASSLNAAKPGPPQQPRSVSTFARCSQGYSTARKKSAAHLCFVCVGCWAGLGPVPQFLVQSARRLIRALRSSRAQEADSEARLIGSWSSVDFWRYERQHA